jgi:hypothetical protein
LECPIGIKCIPLHPSSSPTPGTPFPGSLLPRPSQFHATHDALQDQMSSGETSSVLPCTPCLHFRFRHSSCHMWEDEPLHLLVWGRKCMFIRHF